MIFTGQAWNMTFSLYHSFKSVPLEFQEAGTVYGFTWWERLKWIELPFGTTGLVWNSMMSMAGGWFFLMITEAFQLGDQDFRLPGLGSYMSVAVEKGSAAAMIWAIVAMVVMIVFLDQVLWRPIVVLAQRFRIEDTSAGDAPRSWLLRLLRRSRIIRLWEAKRTHRRHAVTSARTRRAMPAAGPRSSSGSTGGWPTWPWRAWPRSIVWGSVALILFLTAISRGTWSTLRRPAGSPCPGCSSPPSSAPSGRCPRAWPSGSTTGCPGSSSPSCRWRPPSPPPCCSRGDPGAASSGSGSTTAAWC